MIQLEQEFINNLLLLDYKIEKNHGNLDVDEGEYALSDLSYFRGIEQLDFQFINVIY